MNHYKLLQKTDYLLASALMLASVVLLYSAGVVVGTPQATIQTLAKHAAPMVVQQCEASLKSLGINYNKQGNVLTVAEPSQRELSSLVERASMALMACPGTEVATFCAGENCLPERGLTMALKPRAAE